MNGPNDDPLDKDRHSPKRIAEVREMNAAAEKVFARVVELLDEADRELARLPEHPDYGRFIWDSTGETMHGTGTERLRMAVFNGLDAARFQLGIAKRRPETPYGLSNMSFFLRFFRQKSRSHS